MYTFCAHGQSGRHKRNISSGVIRFMQSSYYVSAAKIRLLRELSDIFAHKILHTACIFRFILLIRYCVHRAGH